MGPTCHSLFFPYLSFPFLSFLFPIWALALSSQPASPLHHGGRMMRRSGAARRRRGSALSPSPTSAFHGGTSTTSSSCYYATIDAAATSNCHHFSSAMACFPVSPLVLGPHAFPMMGGVDHILLCAIATADGGHAEWLWRCRSTPSFFSRWSATLPRCSLRCSHSSSPPPPSLPRSAIPLPGGMKPPESLEVQCWGRHHRGHERSLAFLATRQAHPRAP